MDINSLMDPLNIKVMIDADMDVEKARRLKRLEIHKKIDDLQVASFNKLQSLLTNLQTALTGLSTAFSTVGFQVNSSNTATATASITNNNISPGTHTINVTQLATAETNVSGVFTSANSNLNVSETLTFTNTNDPSSTFNVTVNPGDSLQNIASNINNANNNTLGITATVMSYVALDGVTPQYQLIISTESTGTNSAYTISGDTSNAFNFAQTTTAQNALFTFDNYNQVSQSNMVGNSDGTGGVIQGLSFNLLATGTTTLNVTAANANQNQAVQNAIPAFITAYNEIMSFIDKTQIDHTTANPTFTTIKSTIQDALNDAFTTNGDINTLSATGIVLAPYTTQEMKLKNLYTDKDYMLTCYETGCLQSNTNANNGKILADVIATDFQSFSNFFTNSSTGLIASLNNAINNTVLSGTNGGLIPYATSQIQTDETAINQKIKAQNKILERVKERLTEKWTKANVLFSKMNNTIKFLDRQYDSIANFGKND